MEDNEDKETSTDEVQSTREYKQNPDGGGIFHTVHPDPGAHPSSYTMDTGSVSRG
jgi:hypothetical protein